MSVCPSCHASYDATVRICPTDGTPLPIEAAPDANIGQLLEGKYRIDAFISAGGMGSVYRATHVMLDKTVAIKLIRKELVTTADASTRFQREARAASNLEHPNIAAVFDFGQAADGTLYIAMEYVEGPNLKEVIQNGGAMEPARIVAILGPVASALARAHRHHIIHRDLKPHNIMLATDKDGRLTPKLLDFGIAKTVDEATSALTMTGRALGTPQYMSPEQATGAPVDGRSDLYSLGVVLYEMLIGDVPFADTSVFGVLLKQMTVEPEAPSRRRPDVHISPVLEAIALRCLQKEPDERFQSAEEFITALSQTGAGAIPAVDAPTKRTPAAAVVPEKLEKSDAIGAPAAATLDAAHLTTPAPLSSSTIAPGRKAPQTMVPLAASVSGQRPGEPMAAQPIVDATDEPSARDIKPGTQPTVVVPALALDAASPPSRQSTWPGPTFWVAAAVVLLAVGGSAEWMIRTWAPPLTQTDEPAPAPTATPAMAQPAPSVETAPEAPSSEAASSTSRQDTSTSQSSESIARGRGAVPPVVIPPVERPAGQPASMSRATPAAAAGSSLTAASAGAARAQPPPPATAPSGDVPARAVPETGGTAQAGREPPADPVAPNRVKNPTVFVQCNGPSEICSPVRSAMADALRKDHMPLASAAARADVIVAVEVALVEQRIQQSFGTTFAPRTYSVDVHGESHGLVVSMPPPRTFSFDAQVGRERANENARLIASDAVDALRDFWNRRP